MSLKHRKLGRTSDQRRAMLRAMVTYLLENGQIKTTYARAKEVAPVCEKMITLAKHNNLASYRQALSFITKEDVAKKLFDEIGPKYATRDGGYTRVVNGNRSVGVIPASRAKRASCGPPAPGSPQEALPCFGGKRIGLLRGKRIEWKRRRSPDAGDTSKTA